MVARDLRHVLIFKQRCSCANKGWSWNYQCKVTWDNGACVSLKTQLKHTCIHTRTHTRVHVCGQTHKCTKWRTRAIVSHSAHVDKSMRTTHNSLQHIRTERRYHCSCMLQLIPLHVKVHTETWWWPGAGFSPSGAKKPRRYTAILWEKERQTNKQQ